MRLGLRLVLSVGCACALLAVTSASVPAHPVKDRPAQSRDKIIDYWSADRMADAVPARQEKTKPAKGGGGGSSSGGSSSGASSEVGLPYPSGYGKVYFTSNRGVNYVCSGTALTSSNQSVVWTAGHCVNEGPGDFYKNFLFVPAYRDGAAPYGKFAATTLMTTSGWQSNGEFGVDVGAAIVGRNASNQTLSSAVNERTPAFNSTRNQSYSLYGYPAGKPFNGQRLRVCNTSWLLDDTSAAPPTMAARCDMTGGSSGGAWVPSSGTVASVVSYGYANLRNVLFGPHLETEAQQLYNAAQSG